MKKGIFILTFLLASIAAHAQWTIDKGHSKFTFIIPTGCLSMHTSLKSHQDEKVSSHFFFCFCFPACFIVRGTDHQNFFDRDGAG